VKSASKIFNSFDHRLQKTDGFLYFDYNFAIKLFSKLFLIQPNAVFYATGIEKSVKKFHFVFIESYNRFVSRFLH
jgi:hypothetical protein